MRREKWLQWLKAKDCQKLLRKGRKKEEAYYLDYNNINLDCSMWTHSFRQLGRTQFFILKDITAKTGNSYFFFSREKEKTNFFFFSCPDEIIFFYLFQTVFLTYKWGQNAYNIYV